MYNTLYTEHIWHAKNSTGIKTSIAFYRIAMLNCLVLC